MVRPLAVLRAAGIIAAHLALVILIALTNASDENFRLGVLLVPLVLTATALAGLVAGLAVAATATIALYFAQDTNVPIAVAVANVIVRAAVFVTLCALVHLAQRQTRRLREQQERITRELATRAEYTSVVAHELRNPLVGIRAAARGLAARPGGAVAVAEAIGVESAAALELLDGLSEVASMEAGRQRVTLHRVDLADIVQEAVRLVDLGAHELVVQGVMTPAPILGDQARLAQVLKNLIVNAAKYSPDGTRIEVSLGVTSDRRRAVVTVRDHGPGIPPAERGKLFQKFSRLSTAGATRGSGLGLFICSRLIQDHGGELVADWPAGGGTAFSFALDLVGVRATDPNVADAPTRVDPAPATERRRQRS